jgi:prepilin-type N-terminal cleavage/methylation domain-containing protein
VSGRRRNGFTLLELLVVMTIIATLLTIAVPR